MKWGGDVANILDVAKASGYSKSTVSRVFVDPENVHPATREKILKVAEALNYMPNAVARSMITKRTENIGFIIYEKQAPVFSNPFYGPILQSIVNGIEQKGYSLFLASDKELRMPSGEIMLRKQVDGVILASQTDAETVQSFQRRGIPVVLLNYQLAMENVYCVLSNDYGGIKQAVEYFIKGGHENIGLLSGQFTPFIFERRFQAFMDVMRSHDLTPDGRFIQTAELTIGAAYRQTANMFRQKEIPSALLCTNDIMAVGAIKAIHKAGLCVPDDIEVIGYDNSEYCQVCDPELSSVDGGKDRLGDLAVKLLMKLIDGKPPADKVLSVDARLVLRDSTRKHGK